MYAINEKNIQLLRDSGSIPKKYVLIMNSMSYVNLNAKKCIDHKSNINIVIYSRIDNPSH